MSELREGPETIGERVMNVNKAREKRFARLHRVNCERRPVEIPVPHYGMNSRTCNVLRSIGKADPELLELCPEEEKAGRLERMVSPAAKTYHPFPGDRPPEAIAGTLPDGSRVPIYALEMVYNDAMLINAICGEGKYESLAGETEKAILELARTLYGESLIPNVN